MRNRRFYSTPPDYDISIFSKPCPNCSSPIFFGYQHHNSILVECGKCHAKLSIVHRKRRFEVVSVVNTDSIVIRCNELKCGYVFVLEKLEEQLARCPNCSKKFYVRVMNPELYIRSISQSQK